MTILEQVHDEKATNVPGVDVVLAVDDSMKPLLDARALKLVGALHRRFWNRRREMLQRRARAGIAHSSTAIYAASSDHAANLATAATWQERLSQLQILSDVDETATDQIVATRGWADTESGVLVDGRAVPGCVFDLAITLSLVANRLRDGESPFIFSIPEPMDVTETKLWTDLLTLAEDRLGVERGVVRAGVLGDRLDGAHVA